MNPNLVLLGLAAIGAALGWSGHSITCRKLADFRECSCVRPLSHQFALTASASCLPIASASGTAERRLDNTAAEPEMRLTSNSEHVVRLSNVC